MTLSHFLQGPFPTFPTLLVSGIVLVERLVAMADELSQTVGVLSAMVDDTAPAHVLEIWAIVLVILGTIVLMSFLMFGPAMSIIIYRMWKSPPQNSVA
ncbi:small integral membrane protein 3-like [Pristis pectinata]|uniref:small integral membrane protein 3-like n=1 Tax=Pristis pectinata TaxID=685728 RepID=UPI00223E3D57|nr:small integral membrane protein 3-like [Pristis pectinata]